MIGLSELVGMEPWLLSHTVTLARTDIGDSRRLSSALREAAPTLRTEFRRRMIECEAGSDLRTAASVLDHAEEIIDVAPKLRAIIRFCVHEVILLRAPDDTYDVSHSEPRWPNRIFVSVPRPSQVQLLRLAESVVHEAMHLNLTLAEHLAPLVCSERTLASPWRLEPRPAAGVLHGIYVFCCISRFFTHLQAATNLQPIQAEHVHTRQNQIAEQLASIDRRALRKSLTSPGVELLENLYRMASSPTFHGLRELSSPR